MKQTILDGTLAPRHREAGISLVETDDHFLVLSCKTETIARWSATGATVFEIIKEADKWLREKKQ